MASFEDGIDYSEFENIKKTIFSTKNVYLSEGSTMKEKYANVQKEYGLATCTFYEFQRLYLIGKEMNDACMEEMKKNREVSTEFMTEISREVN